MKFIVFLQLIDRSTLFFIDLHLSHHEKQLRVAVKMSRKVKQKTSFSSDFIPKNRDLNLWLDEMPMSVSAN